MTDTIKSFAGAEVAVATDVWILDADVTLHLGHLFAPARRRGRDPVADAATAYLMHAARTLSAARVKRICSALRGSLGDPGVREALDGPDGAFLSAVHALKAGADRSHRAGFVDTLRAFYVWSADACLEGFDPDAATAMAAFAVGRGRTGTAVLREDPNEGPLSEWEARRLGEALREAFRNGSAPLRWICATLLLLRLGCNPETLRRLYESDLKEGADADGNRVLVLHGVKKGVADRRAFPRRMLVTPATAEVVEALVRENHRRDGAPAADRPLFLPRDTWRGRDEMDGASLPFFANAARGIVDALALKNDAGDPLQLNPRRLRYTFAKMHVDAGASAEELAILLDHWSTACVMVYFHPRSDIVPRLDAALGERLAPFAAVAMGTAAAPPAERARPSPHALGEAPFACLGCRLFRPSGGQALTRLADALQAADGDGAHRALVERAAIAREALDGREA